VPLVVSSGSNHNMLMESAKQVTVFPDFAASIKMFGGMSLTVAWLEVEQQSLKQIGNDAMESLRWIEWNT
jgi:uncharacterized 2Fe-2S/4Fe-4S cluster protein (DUF4445 family)